MLASITRSITALINRIITGPTCPDCDSTLGSIGYSNKFCWVCTGLLPAPKGKEDILADKAAALRGQADAIETQLHSTTSSR